MRFVYHGAISTTQKICRARNHKRIKKLQPFWAAFAVFLCYASAMATLLAGGPDRNERVPGWALNVVHSVFLAIFLVALQFGLCIQEAQSQQVDDRVKP